MSNQFEDEIAQLTLPLNGQFPRPWMSDLEDPLLATHFIVGKNQRNGYPVERLTHSRHLNGLFNRSGESCRGVYDEITGGKPSPTRDHTDHLRRLLRSEGVTKVLETNVVCYSTPMSVDLRLPQHRGGTIRGTHIFRTLLHYVKPRVLIAHGAGTRNTLSELLEKPLPQVPNAMTNPEFVRIDGMMVFIIPSLSPPEWNKWQTWAEPYLAKVAKLAA